MKRNLKYNRCQIAVNKVVIDIIGAMDYKTRSVVCKLDNTDHKAKVPNKIILNMNH